MKYDPIGNLAEATQLTRNTVASILKGINVAVFSQYKTNPEDFIAKAGTPINEQKATATAAMLGTPRFAQATSLGGRPTAVRRHHFLSRNE